MAAVASLNIKAEKRSERGKELAKKARRNGRIPGVIYGAHGESVAVSVDDHEFLMLRQHIAGEQKLITVDVTGGASESAFIKDLQREPVSRKVIHVDFLRVNPDEELTMPVHVKVVGSSPEGVREGGLLEQLAHEVEVTARPGDMPGHIDVDLTNLKVGESVHVSELPALPNAKYASSPDLALFTIISKAKVEADAAAADAAAAPAEPVAEEGAAPTEEKEKKD